MKIHNFVRVLIKYSSYKKCMQQCMRCIEDKQHATHCCNKKLYGKLFVYFYGKTNNHNNKNNNNNDLTSHVCPNQQSRRGNDKHFNMKWM